MLTFNVKKVWFDKIKSGEKTHEYREVKDFWTDRFIKEFFNITRNRNPYAFLCYKVGMNNYLRGDKASYNNPLICFMNGMLSEAKQPRLYAKMKSITIINGKNTDLKTDEEVFDIEFELIK